MTTETNLDTIDNFSVFDTVYASIILIRYDDENGTIYNALANLILEEEPIKLVTTNTTIIEEDPKVAIVKAYNALTTLYNDVLDHVTVLDSLGEEIEDESYSVAEILEEIDPTDNL